MAGSDGTVFINYRRDDTKWPAKTIYEELTRRIGPERVFKDVDNIELGENFVEQITAAVARCEVMLSLIGEDWLDSKDAQGRRRLDNPRDFVRLEIETALQRGVRVIPILVDGAEMPPAESLPESLRPLTERQAVSISPERVEIDRLVKALTASFGRPAQRPGQPGPAFPGFAAPGPAYPPQTYPAPARPQSPSPSYQQFGQTPPQTGYRPGQPAPAPYPQQAGMPQGGYPPQQPAPPAGPQQRKQLPRPKARPQRLPWFFGS